MYTIKVFCLKKSKFSLIDFDKQKWIFLIILAKKWIFLPKSATLFGIFDPKKVQD